MFITFFFIVVALFLAGLVSFFRANQRQKRMRTFLRKTLTKDGWIRGDELRTKIRENGIMVSIIEFNYHMRQFQKERLIESWQRQGFLDENRRVPLFFKLK